jgi:hypothetical protein
MTADNPTGRCCIIIAAVVRRNSHGRSRRVDDLGRRLIRAFSVYVVMQRPVYREAGYVVETPITQRSISISNGFELDLEAMLGCGCGCSGKAN